MRKRSSKATPKNSASSARPSVTRWKASSRTKNEQVAICTRLSKACHPERSEGSPKPRSGWITEKEHRSSSAGFFAAFRMTARLTACIEELRVSAYRIPTDFPESDGTYEWSSTTLVVVEARAEGTTSLGYSYADLATAKLIEDHLKNVVVGRDAMAVGGAWQAMVNSIRNIGRPGIASMAISAVDNALWDLKARLLDLPLVTLLGGARESLPIYGSGGFTSYSN